MWKKVLIIIAIILLLTGIGFVLFPPVSNFVGQQRANQVIADYETAADNVISEEEQGLKEELGITAKSFQEARQKKEVDEQGYPINPTTGERIYDRPVTFVYDLNKLHEDSKAYNASILYHQGTVDTADYERAALNMSDYGLSDVYGYLSAPSVDMYLPIYLGGTEESMAYGGGHLYGTSLPLDDKDTNVVIGGHTGYIGRIFFDNIRYIPVGEKVTIKNYWETIDYKVVEHKVIRKDDSSELYIFPGKQKLVLVTCISGDAYNRHIVICEKE